MKKSDFRQLLVDTHEAMMELTATKGEEYANNESFDDSDQHANFNRQSDELGLNPEQVLMVYLSKHMDAIKSYTRTGAVHSEPITGRIDDAILYLILLKGLVMDRQNFDPVFSPCHFD